MNFWKPNLNNNEKPLYRAIAEAIRDAFESGELNPGDRLPPYRHLADELGVTIGTVGRGYKLASEWGLISCEVGRGSIVKNPKNIYPHFPIDQNDSYIDMGFIKPTPTTDSELRKHAYVDTLKLVSSRWENSAFHGYPPEFGNSLHREAGASWIRRRGIQASADEVLLTAGSQEAIHLLLSTYTNPGDSILVEENIIVAIKSLCNVLNLKMIGVQLDEQGLIPQSLEKEISKSKAQIVFLTPTLQNPTATIMTAERRQNIAKIACHNNLLIIENDPFSEFIVNAPPPIAHYAPNRTAYVTTLSYSGSPEIRIGYIKLSKNKIPDLQPTKRAFTISGSLISAEIATRWINSGILERLTQWQICEIKARYHLIDTVFKGFSYQYAPNGLFLWLKLPEPIRALDVALAAKERKIIVLEAERFMIGHGTTPQAIRISLTSTQNRELFKNGLKIIADLINKPAKLSL